MSFVPSFSSLGDALAEVASPSASVTDRRAVSGGDINRAYRLTLSDGTAVFLKANTASLLPMFAAEAEGLHAMAETGAIGVPEPRAVGTDPDLGAFLLLDWVDAAPAAPGFWEDFGMRLAAFHNADPSAFVPEGRYGFSLDNYIGSTPQINTPRDTWVGFFRECRLEPQFRMAFDAGYLDPSARAYADRLLSRLDELLLEPEHPSLLHGDLWSGNFMTGPDGRAWLIDPAAYVGHREADLAMTELFGGYSPAFYSAYKSVAPLQPGYEDRRDIYNLYHLLNHVNLFGFSYTGAVMRLLTKYGR